MNIAPKTDGKLSVPKPSQQPVRAAILGTGYFADFHARAIRYLEGVELVGVCDANLRSTQSFAANRGPGGL